MMDKPKFLYIVRSSSGRTLHIWDVSSNQAKRIFCKEYGIHPGDYWCGVRSLTARKLKPEEVKAWETDADTERATLVFIRGMMNICAKVYAEQTATEGVRV